MSGGTPPVTTRSPITMRPSLRGTRPAINPSSVVLPHPEGPTRLTNRPDATRKLTSRTAVNSPVGVSNVRVTLSRVIIAGPVRGDDSIRSAEEMAMDLGIKNKVAIVTGGSRGIGRETARTLLEAGARVMICGRTAATVEATRAELHAKTGGEVLGLVADMAVEADAERLVRETTARLGSVDILVNNAGQMYSGRFDALTEAGLRSQLDIKLFGFMRAIRLVIPEMKARRWGRIVNIIGGAGKEPDPYMLGSGIVNSALLNITKSLSTELGADNVLVNAVCPGWVDTGMWRRNASGLQAELN